MTQHILYWVASKDGSMKGPVPISVLKQWVIQGTILPDTMLKNDAADTLIRADSLPGLFDASPLESGPPPPMQVHYPRPNQSSAGSYGVIDMLVPARADAFAVAAGYFGLLSLVIIGAPFAILFGVFALHRIKQHPERTGKGRAWFGIILGTGVLSFGAIAVVASMLR